MENHHFLVGVQNLPNSWYHSGQTRLNIKRRTWKFGSPVWRTSCHLSPVQSHWYKMRQGLPCKADFSLPEGHPPFWWWSPCAGQSGWICQLSPPYQQHLEQNQKNVSKPSGKRAHDILRIWILVGTTNFIGTISWTKCWWIIKMQYSKQQLHKQKCLPIPELIYWIAYETLLNQ